MITKSLANILTTLSLLSGFISIIFSLEAHFTFASWAIIVSVVLDGLDGQVARLYNNTSQFGKEYDSLVDVICFGIAPSILGYIFVYSQFHLFATVALFFYLICSVFRLAKYNITPKETMKAFFYGLPTTVSGGVVAAFILIYRRYTSSPPPTAFLILVFALGALMVSRVKYPNLDAIKQILFKDKVMFIVILSMLTAGTLAMCNILGTNLFFELLVFEMLVIYLLFFPFLVKQEI